MQKDWVNTVDRLGDATATMRAEIAVHASQLRGLLDELKSIRESLNHGEAGLIPRLAVVEQQVEQMLETSPQVEERKARISARGVIISTCVLAVLTLLGVIVTALAQIVMHVWKK